MIIISRTDALIGIHTTPAKVSIQQPKADFEMHTEYSKLEMHTEQVQVQIDQQQCFNESGLKDYATLTRDNVMEAQQAVMEGIARRVSEGDMMASLKSGKHVIAEIAFNNSFEQHVFDIDTVPKSKPQIDFIGGTVDIRVHEGYVDIQSRPNKPIIDVQIGGVEFYMRQNPEIRFEYVGKKLDELV